MSIKNRYYADDFDKEEDQETIQLLGFPISGKKFTGNQGDYT